MFMEFRLEPQIVNEEFPKRTRSLTEAAYVQIQSPIISLNK